MEIGVLLNGYGVIEGIMRIEDNLIGVIFSNDNAVMFELNEEGNCIECC